MLEIKFICHHCGTKILIDESAFGIQIQCPSCSRAMLAPAGRQVNGAGSSESGDKSSLVHEGFTIADLGVIKRQQKRLEDAVSERVQRLAELDRLVEAKENELQGVIRRCEEEEQHIANSRAALVQEQANMHQKQEQARCDLDNIQALLRQSDEGYAKAQQRLKSLSAEVKEREEELQGLVQSVSRARQESEQTRQELELECSELEESISSRKQEWGRLDEAIAKLNKHKVSISEQLEAAKVELEQLQNRSEEQRKLNIQEQKTATERLERIVAETALSEQKHFEASQRLTLVQQELGPAVESLKALQAEAKKTGEELVEQQDSLKDSLRQVDRLGLERDEMTHQISTLTESLEVKQKQLSKLQPELDRLNALHSAAEKDYSGVMQQLEYARRELQQLERDYFERFVKPYLPADLFDKWMQEEPRCLAGAHDLKGKRPVDKKKKP